MKLVPGSDKFERRLDFHNYVLPNFNNEQLSQVFVKVGIYLRLIQIFVRLFLQGENDNSILNWAIVTNLFTPISVPLKDEKNIAGNNIGAKVSNYLLVDAKINIACTMMLIVSKCLAIMDSDIGKPVLTRKLNMDEFIKGSENRVKVQKVLLK